MKTWKRNIYFLLLVAILLYLWRSANETRTILVDKEESAKSTVHITMDLEQHKMTEPHQAANITPEERNKERVKYIHDQCNKSAAIRRNLNLKDFHPRLFVSDRYSLIYCLTPKVSSTSWLRLFAVLTGVLNTTGDKIDKPMINYPLPKMRLRSKEQREYAMKKYRKLMVTREPFERVLSCYINKLIPKREKVTPLFGSLAANIAKRYGNDPAYRYPSFQQFVEFITDSNKYNIKMAEWEPIHWQPQHTLCKPCEISYDYVLNIDTMEEDAEYFLRDIGAPENLHLPLENTRKGTTQKEGLKLLFKRNSLNISDSEIAKIANDSRNLFAKLTNFTDNAISQKLYDYFLTDYDLFGYQRPNML